MSNSKLTIEQAETILLEQIENNKVLQTTGRKPIAYVLEGPAGIGKTLMVEALAEATGTQFVVKNLGQLREAGDLVGYPIVELELKKDTGESRWVLEKSIKYTKEENEIVTGKSRMGYALPEWFQNIDPTKPGILFLDDYTRANSDVLQAAMEIIYMQRYYSWELPKNWTVVISTNPNNGEYQVSDEDDAQRSRKIKLEVEFNLDVWSKWAEKQGFNPMFINFLNLFPAIVDKKHNVRDFTLVIDSLYSLSSDLRKNMNKCFLLVESHLGSTTASLFKEFVDKDLHLLPTPKKILETKTENMEKLIKDTVTVDGKVNVTRQNFITNRLIQYIAANYKTRIFNKAESESLFALLDLDNSIYAEGYKMRLLQAMVEINIKMGDILAGNALFTKLVLY